MTEPDIGRRIEASHLLPDPGGEVVRTALRELQDAHERLDATLRRNASLSVQCDAALQALEDMAVEVLAYVRRDQGPSDGNAIVSPDEVECRLLSHLDPAARARVLARLDGE